MQNTKPRDSSEKHRREDHCQVNSWAISALGVGGSRREPLLLGERRRSGLDLSTVLRGHSDFPIQLSIYWVRSGLVPHQYIFHQSGVAHCLFSPLWTVRSCSCATFLTLTFPLRMSFVTSRIDDQSSNTVNGIPWRSQ